jgi:hypothetical protein
MAWKSLRLSQSADSFSINLFKMEISMINTNEVLKTDLTELREEAYQDALEKAFNAEYKELYATYRNQGYSEEEANYCAQDEARAIAKESYVDYLV